MAVKKSDARARINEFVDEFVARKEFGPWLDEMLDATKAQWAYCPKCHQKVQADFPDYKGRAEVLKMLLAEGKGRPAETRRLDVSITHKDEIRALTDEELAQLLEG